MSAHPARPRIVVAGGGFAGLEATFYLRMRLGEDADITLLSDSRHAVFRPNTIYIPFGLDPAGVKIDLARPVRRRGITFVYAPVEEIDPANKLVVHTDYRHQDYDFLFVATGARTRPGEIPGMAEHGHSMWSLEDMLDLRRSFGALVEDAHGGSRRRVLFVLPPHNRWGGPLYEMALMLDTWLREQGARELVSLDITTYEHAYMREFGPKLHESIAGELEARDIHGHTGRVVTRVAKAKVEYEGGESLPFHLLVTFPAHAASSLFGALPTDERGFISTLLGTRQVVGHPEVYAIGDTGDFPVKQAYLALLQADAAAEHLVSQIRGGEAAEFQPATLFELEQLGRRTVAQVPLAPATGTGDEFEVQLNTRATEAYRVGTAISEGLGKRFLGADALPWRPEWGHSFRVGLPWGRVTPGRESARREIEAANTRNVK